jgi:hypothetical protein
MISSSTNSENSFSESPFNEIKFQDNREIQIRETLPVANEEKIIPGYKRCFYKTLTVSCIVLDTPFLFVLIVAIFGALRYGLTQWGLEGPLVDIISIALASLFATLRSGSDAILANPIESAVIFASPSHINRLESKIKKSNPCKKILTKSLIFTNQVIANLSYIIGSFSNTLPIAYLSSSPLAQWLPGVPIVGFTVLYFNLVYWEHIKEHAYEFIHRLVDCKNSMIINALRAPMQSLEVLIQSLSSAFFMAMSFAYVAHKVLQLFFRMEEDDPKNLPYICITAALTFYINIFYRTLNVHREIFNDQWERLPREVLNSTRVSIKGSAFDVLMTILRAAPTSTLLYRHGSANKPVNLSITIIAGCLVLFHGLYVRYLKRLNETALQKTPASMQRLLFSSSIQESNDLNSEAIFDKITESYKTENLKKMIARANLGGRIGGSLALLGFLVDFNEILSSHNVIHLDFYDILCIHQLWGNTSLENEYSFYKKNMVDNYAYYRAKYAIEKYQPLYGWGAFWKAKSEYPAGHLQDFLHTLQDQDQSVVNPVVFSNSRMINS